VQSALAGFVVLVLAAWAKYVFNRLWQKTLVDSAADALLAATALGLTVEPLGFGPVIVATGIHDGRTVRVEWRGGWNGETTRIRIDGRVHRTQLVRTASALERLLSSEE
jgi:hypothetical protein